MATSHWAVGFTLEGKKKLIFFSRFRLSLFDIVELFLLPSLSTNSLILCKSPTEMKIDRFLRRRLVYLFVVGAVEWSISSSSVLWRSPTEMMFGDDLDSPLIHILIGEMKEEKNSQLLGAFTNTTLVSFIILHWDLISEAFLGSASLEEEGTIGEYGLRFK